VEGAHLSFLYWVTLVINLMALVLTIWLGLFIVSRSPKYLIAWLTALTFWCIAAMFMNTLLAINPPPAITLESFWLRFVFPFWPIDTLAGNNNKWLQGWSVAPALVLWHHVTVLTLPGKTTAWRWVRIMLGYLLAVVAIIVQTNAQILFTAESSNPLFLNSLHAGPWYPIFAVAMVILTWTCVYNLIIASRSAKTSINRKQFQILAWASLAAGLAGFVSIAASYYMVPIPLLVISVLVAIPVGLIGWSVARFGIYIEMRVIQKDFLYNLFLLGLVILVYVPISMILINSYHAPMAVLAVFPSLAVITHSSMAAIYRFMDRFFYHQDARQLRLRLRQLWKTVESNGTMEAFLTPFLDTICNTVDADNGLLLVFENNVCKNVVSYHFSESIPEIETQMLTADDTVYLKPNQLPYPLNEASILVPVYGDVDQIGALILGKPQNGLYYAPEDIDQVLEFSDEIGESIQRSYRNAQYLAQIAELIQAHANTNSQSSKPISSDSLELALRNLYDYAFLGDSPLAEMNLVKIRLPEGQVTHLERGKAVHDVIHEALEKLRPSSVALSNPPSREWYPYLILQEAYLNETSNRDIMLKLYISEGTFNRTRRIAIRSLARALGELEASIS
jgi:hypothetical protein